MSLNDDDRLRLLSDAERAAMEEDNDQYDPEADNAAALAELGRGALDAEEDDDEDEKGKVDPTTPTDPTDPAETPAAPAAAPASSEVPTDPTQPTEAPPPPAQAAQQAGGYRVDLPADYDAQVKGNKDAMAAARAKFNDGELERSQQTDFASQTMERHSAPCAVRVF